MIPPARDPGATRGCPVGHGTGAAGLHGPEAAEDPHAFHERLRERYGAVAPVLVEGDVPAWLVLGYRENRRVLENPLQFGRDSRSWREWREGRVPDTSPLMQMIGRHPDRVSQDGEAHRRVRAAVTDSLLAVAGRGVRRHVAHFAGRRIDAFADTGRADLVADFADQLPMLVLTRVFGLAECEGRALAESSARVVRGGADALAHNERIVGVLAELVARKRVEPGADFTTGLIAHHARLEEQETVQLLRSVLVTAHTTTSNLLARVLESVLTDPDQYSGLVGAELDIASVVEEVMWNSPPLAVLPGRFATADLELGECLVREGDLLLLGLAAGNRDPLVRPDTGISVGGNHAHLAFSAGPHECPGQNIGHGIVETAVHVLLHRLPGLRLAVPAGELTSTASMWESRLDALPVEFDVPAGAAHPSWDRYTGTPPT
ncbi:cytochrome P450 [Streptomyces sp. NPDC093970]|uniref:cytochrome P450 n=1 Tax=Streptomyces sp. NPDC093970 TaxID=3155076 RepID=UPI00342D02C3